MSISNYPSKLSLPQVNPGVETVLEYLIVRFPDIAPHVWQQRALEGKIHYHDGTLITAASPYQPQQRVYYYREVDADPVIPFEEKILFQDDQLLIAYKPPFLPVTPGGRYVNECLQSRLRENTGVKELQALHRLDRVTTGLVMFSVNPETCHLYHRLFEVRQIEKTYQAVSMIHSGIDPSDHITPAIGQNWEISNRLETSKPRFLMRITKGNPNSHSSIRCLQKTGNKALFELKPTTGKTHQLRVHMQALGWPIMNDRYYPVLQPESADDYSQPLQLLARELRFIDPVSLQPRVFSCDEELTLISD